jgi:hypothetical protein
MDTVAHVAERFNVSGQVDPLGFKFSPVTWQCAATP